MSERMKLTTENYNRLGPLTDQQFLAAKEKATSQRLIYAENLEPRLTVWDSYGRENNIPIDRLTNEFESGNVAAIRLKATVANMAGGKEQSGYLKLENLRDAQFNPETGVLLIDSDQCCITNLDCWQAMSDLYQVINDPTNWVNERALSGIIEPDLTLKDFKQIRDDHDRTIDSPDYDAILMSPDNDREVPTYNFGGQDLLF
jgi:hypothetical protein